MSVKNAVEKYLNKQLKKSRTNKRTNKKPEKEVEKQVLNWAKKFGFDLHVVESKNTYSHASGRYTGRSTSESMSDLVGNHKATAVYIELKAPGRRSTLKEHQRAFLERKINQGCFACCVDSVNLLEGIWDNWTNLEVERGKKFLIEQLPRQKASRQKKSPADEIPW